MTTTTLQFRDVSNHDGEYNGTGPVFAKATEGRSFVDKQYARNKARTLDRGDPFAGYHYLDVPAVASIVDQAKHAFSIIGPDTCAMLDVERTTKGSPAYRDALLWTETYLGLGGFVRPLYLPEWFWSGVWKSPSLKAFSDLGLWLISSNYTTYTDGGRGWRAYGGMTPLVWQWAGSPDRDAFRGTKTNLALALARAGKPTPPKPPATHAPGSRTLRLASPLMSGADVLYAQRFIGTPAGADDGVYGPATVRGVKWYQAMRGAKGPDVDGILGPWTWGQMGIEYTG